MSRFRLFALNDEQVEAVQHEHRPMLILGGAAISNSGRAIAQTLTRFGL
jgi:hypothetical protein